MYLLDENNAPVDAEFSLDLVDSENCIVVESSGGSNPARGIARRNPEYTKLLSIIFSRLANANIRISRVVLDSEKVANIPVENRIAKLDFPYPVDLTGLDPEAFRKMLGRKIAAMHRDPEAKQGGNAQKRIRICLEHPVLPEQLMSSAGTSSLVEPAVDYAPSLGATEREYLAAARVGQGGFRRALLKQFGGICPVVGISNPDLLVASHIKPWNVCNNSERLDSQNGLLLSTLVDRLFDRGLVTFSDEGNLLISPKLSKADRDLCSIDAAKPIGLTQKNRIYMAYHRMFKFQST